MFKIEKNSFYIGTWIRHDDYGKMQVGRVVEADSTGLRSIVVYQDGSSETLASSFVKRHFVYTMKVSYYVSEYGIKRNMQKVIRGNIKVCMV